MRRRLPSLLGLLGAACSPGAEVRFIEAPDSPAGAASAIVIFEPKDESPFALALDLRVPSTVQFDLDSFDEAEMHSSFYPCSLEALELPTGRIELSTSGRPLLESSVVLSSRYARGDQSPWTTTELPTRLSMLRLSLSALEPTSVLAPCVLVEGVGGPISVPDALESVGENLRWIDVVGGDEIITMTQFGELLRGTPDRIERLAATGINLSDGAMSEEQTWWVVDRAGHVYSGDLAGQVVDRGRTQTASASGSVTDRDDQIVVAPDGSEVYVYSEERVLERCLPSSDDRPCAWEVIGSTDPGTGDHLRLHYFGAGHVLGIAAGSPVLEYRDGRARPRSIFPADSGHAVGDEVPELGTVVLGAAGNVAYRPEDGSDDWIVDDPRFQEAANTVQSRYVVPTRRGFIFGGSSGLVREYDPLVGLCPSVRVGEGVTDLFEAARSETGYWFLARRGEPRLYFVPTKEPSCLQTSSL